MSFTILSTADLQSQLGGISAMFTKTISKKICEKQKDKISWIIIDDNYGVAGIPKNERFSETNDVSLPSIVTALQNICRADDTIVFDLTDGSSVAPEILECLTTGYIPTALSKQTFCRLKFQPLSVIVLAKKTPDLNALSFDFWDLCVGSAYEVRSFGSP